MAGTAVADATTTTTTAPVTTQTTTQPYYADVLKSDGTLNHSSWERLPDHLKDLRPTLEKQKDFDSVLGALSHYQSLAGKKALTPLAANAPKEVIEERGALLDSLNGVPKEAKDYGITKEAVAKDLPDSAWNQPLADNFVKWAKENHVAPGAVRDFITKVQMPLVQGQLASQKQHEDQFWGQQQKDFEAIIARENIPSDRAAALVERGAVAFGLDLTNEQTQTFLKGKDARLMAMRHAIAIGEDKSFTGGESGGQARDPGAEALDIQRNPANPEYAIYRNKEGKYSRSQVEAVVNKVNELLRLAADKRSGGAKGGRR